MIYLSVSDDRKYETKSEKSKGTISFFIRCIDCLAKSKEWNLTTKEHLDKMISHKLFTPIN